MVDTLKHVHVDEQTDLGDLLEEARQQPLILGRNDARYRLMREVSRTGDLTEGRDLAADRKRLEKLVGVWSDIDTDSMIEMLYRARALGSKPPIQP